MSRKGLTKVAREKFIKTAGKVGLNVVEKKGWTKVFPAGKAKGAALGIPNTKRVTRIEVVGFTSTHAVAHPAPSADTVTGMLNFEQDEKLILRDFYKACRELEAAAKVAEPVVEPAVEEPAAPEVAVG